MVTTKLFYTNKVNRTVAKSLSEALGFSIAHDLGKYLGVPLIHSKVNNRMYHFILEKMQAKLTNWKAKNLSFAGCYALTNVVLHAISLYTMQIAFVPVKIWYEINVQELFMGSC